MTLSVGLSVTPQDPHWLELAREAERLGVDSIWVPEFWAYDAFTPLAAIAARTERVRLATGIAQLGARTPAMLAMSAMSVQKISGGRFVLGIGTSGPQVMEGWHGVGFSRPVRRTRETIEIIRMITAGERLSYSGEVYQLPLPGGAGAAIRSRADACFVPIYVAALGPANLALTGELADGWIGNSFFPESSEVFLGPLGTAARQAGRSLSDLDLVVAVSVEFTEDVEAAGRRHAAGYAFTFGAMGSRADNFYNNAFARQGFGDDVAEVQRLWAEGNREAAAARVPIEIGLGTNLIGPPDRVRDRLRAYRDCGVTTLRVNPIAGDLRESIAGLGMLVDLVNDVNGGNEPRSLGLVNAGRDVVTRAGQREVILHNMDTADRQGAPDSRYQRPYAVPERLDLLRGPSSGTVYLPPHLDWSGNAVYDLDAPGRVVDLYRAVLIEAASPQDLYAYLDERVLRRLWALLWLPAQLRRAWEQRFSVLAEISRITATA